jgi:hypothetical protein
MIDLSQASQTTTLDPLFVERLQAFLEKSLSEIKSFSERENTPFEEVSSLPTFIKETNLNSSSVLVDPTTCRAVA